LYFSFEKQLFKKAVGAYVTPYGGQTYSSVVFLEAPTCPLPYNAVHGNR